MEGITIEAILSSLRSDSRGGGWRIVFDVPESETDKVQSCLDIMNKRVQLAIVMLPEEND